MYICGKCILTIRMNTLFPVSMQKRYVPKVDWLKKIPKCLNLHRITSIFNKNQSRWRFFWPNCVLVGVFFFKPVHFGDVPFSALIQEIVYSYVWSKYIYRICTWFLLNVKENNSVHLFYNNPKFFNTFRIISDPLEPFAPNSLVPFQLLQRHFLLFFWLRSRSISSLLLLFSNLVCRGSDAGSKTSDMSWPLVFKMIQLLTVDHTSFMI